MYTLGPTIPLNIISMLGVRMIYIVIGTLMSSICLTWSYICLTSSPICLTWSSICLTWSPICLPVRGQTITLLTVLLVIIEEVVTSEIIYKRIGNASREP